MFVYTCGVFVRVSLGTQTCRVYLKVFIDVHGKFMSV